VRERDRDLAWFLRDIDRCERKFPYLFENRAIKPNAVRRLLDAGDLDQFFTGRSAQSDRRVFDAILSSRERDEPCQAVRHLMKLTGLASQTVRDSLQRLLDIGLLIQIAPGASADRKDARRSAIYGISLPEKVWTSLKSMKVAQGYNTPYTHKVRRVGPASSAEPSASLQALQRLKELGRNPALRKLGPDPIRERDEMERRKRDMIDRDADDTWERVCPRCGGRASFLFTPQIYVCNNEFGPRCRRIAWGSPQSWYDIHYTSIRRRKRGRRPHAIAIASNEPQLDHTPTNLEGCAFDESVFTSSGDTEIVGLHGESPVKDSTRRSGKVAKSALQRLRNQRESDSQYHSQISLQGIATYPRSPSNEVLR
jgi:hypothetical protein